MEDVGISWADLIPMNVGVYRITVVYPTGRARRGTSLWSFGNCGNDRMASPFASYQKSWRKGRRVLTYGRIAPTFIFWDGLSGTLSDETQKSWFVSILEFRINIYIYTIVNCLDYLLYNIIYSVPQMICGHAKWRIPTVLGSHVHFVRATRGRSSRKTPSEDRLRMLPQLCWQNSPKTPVPGPVEIVDLPSYNMLDLSIVFCMFSRPGIIGKF